MAKKTMRMSWGNAAALVFLMWVVIAGIDRLTWVNGGSGLQGFVSAGFVADLQLPGCEGRGIEFKSVSKGRVAYRCNILDGNGSVPIWPLQRTGETDRLGPVIARVFPSWAG